MNAHWRITGCGALLFLAGCAQATPTLLPISTLQNTAQPTVTASAASTSTVVPPVLTPTPLPTATPQPLATPIVATGLKFRAPAEAVQAWNTTMRFLESAAFEAYPGDALSQAGQTYTYTVQLAWDEELIWANGWCAATREQLTEEWQTITMEFSANSTPLSPEAFAIHEASGAQMQCRWRYAVVSGWPAGVTQLTTTVTFARPLTNEIRPYPAGTHWYQYQIEKP